MASQLDGILDPRGYKKQTSFVPGVVLPRVSLSSFKLALTAEPASLATESARRNDKWVGEVESNVFPVELALVAELKAVSGTDGVSSRTEVGWDVELELGVDDTLENTKAV